MDVATGAANPARCSIAAGGGRYGNALQLDGQGYVHSGVLTNKAASSISLWFNLPSQTFGNFALVTNDYVWGQALTLDVATNGQFLDAWAPGTNSWATLSNMWPAAESNDGRWHHVVLSCQGRHRDLYFDGRPLISNDEATSCGESGTAGGIRIGGPTWQDPLNNFSPFPGRIDDVRVYPRALTPADVHELFRQPVFRMSFDQQSNYYWKDVSAYQTPVKLPDGYPGGQTTPYAVQNGAAGWGGAFGVVSSFSTGALAGGGPVSAGYSFPYAELDLSGGMFTLSAWVYPYSQSSCTGHAQDQYILGRDYGGLSYPSLVRTSNDANTDLRFKTADNISGAVHGPGLPVNTWTHLVVTYEKDYEGIDSGEAKFYLNGVLKSGQPFGSQGQHLAPASNTQFYIGAPGPVNYMPQYPYYYTYGFCGLIDEVQIFNYALAGEEVEDLMLESAAGLDLALDEPPGASAFSDTSVASHAVGCSSPNCPTAGVGARIEPGGAVQCRGQPYQRSPGDRELGDQRLHGSRHCRRLGQAR